MNKHKNTSFSVYFVKNWLKNNTFTKKDGFKCLEL